MILQAALVLCQGYVPEKFCINQAQNSHLKWCIFLGLGDRQSYSMQCIAVPLVDIQTCTVYMYCICSIYVCVYVYIYIYIYIYICFCTVCVHLCTVYLLIFNSIKI